MANVLIKVADRKKNKNKISRHIYGHFAEHLGRCIYDGFWVGEGSEISNIRGIRNDVVKALRKINIPNLRWPGGCFADEYHWRDGIGPRKDRPRKINTHWGGVIESNEFGTHEFFELCEQLNCEPYISGNVGSGTVKEMAEWIEYITFDGDSTLANLRKVNGRQDPWKVKYWAVGNENWGCGGNMTAKYYADLFCRYSSFCKDLSGNQLYKVACGPIGEYPLDWVINWVDTILERIKLSYDKLLDGISLHYYTRAGIGASATKFKEKKWFLTMTKALYMEKLIEEISIVMNKHDPLKKYGLIIDEWGTWWRVEKGTNPSFLYQQNTLRDAIVASLHLDIFNRHCDRVHMANIAQTINVLQAMILTKGEKMILTPTYHVFDMYQVHQDAHLLPIELSSEFYTYKNKKLPAVHGSASFNDSNIINISLCNIDPLNSVNVKLEFDDDVINSVQGTILTGEKMNSHNDFNHPENVKPTNLKENSFKIDGQRILFEILPMSIIMINVS